MADIDALYLLVGCHATSQHKSTRTVGVFVTGTPYPTVKVNVDSVKVIKLIAVVR